MNDEKKHHVAWADRVGYHKLLFQDLQACSISYGTNYFHKAVWRLYNDIVNIKDGPALKDKIDKYLEEVWIPKRNKKLSKNDELEYGDLSINKDIMDEITSEMMPELCYFIKQLLEDHGFGTYKGEYDGEYDKWD